MNRLPSVAVTLVLFACRPSTPGPATPPSAAPSTAKAPADEPAAAAPTLGTVGDVTLPRAEFDAIVALKVAKYTDRGREPPPKALARYRTSIAARLAHHEQLAQECRRLGLAIDPAALAEREQQERRGIRDWDEHLRRRGETEQSMRALRLADLQETMLAQRQPAGMPDEDDILEAYETQKLEHTARTGWVRAAIATAYTVPLAGGPARLSARCDEYVARYTRCIEQLVPEVARAQMLDALRQSVVVFADVAREGKAEQLDESCTLAMDAARQATESIGCDWTTAAPPSQALPATPGELAEAKRRALALAAAATGPGADLAALAKAEQLEVTGVDRAVPRESLDPATRKALSRLAPGAVTKPLPFAHGYRVIQLLEVHPAGPLPLAARRAEIVEELRLFRLGEATRALREELDERYPVRFHVELAGREPNDGARP